ncbi:MAG: hypothetical protein DHS20C18_55170 [Saprospiraceae bacterium]|nr:MAG: hypothetical protein DHS20C18_55170 [Saprospiraceae bacterium]
MAALGFSQVSGSQQSIELGKVQWQRQFDQALDAAKQNGKPLFILFQEVPGCATCRNYGQQVLSHPLLVEAIETLFVPLAIHNNKQGADAKVLKYYGEPAWNNPVVRIVGADRQDLIPRLNGNYSRLGLVEAMIFALQRAEQDIPAYLELLREEWQAAHLGTETATLSMYCFWTGEKTYGQLDGVVRTQAGFMHGREVVEVEYNPTVVSLESLIEKGKAASCADQVFVANVDQKNKAAKAIDQNKIKTSSSFRPDSEPKYYLSKTHYQYVPMTELQAARANALVGQGKSPEQVLSIRQREMADYVRQHSSKLWKSRIGEGFLEAWEDMERGGF